MAKARQGNYARRDGDQYYVVGTVNGVRKVIPLSRDSFIELYDNMGKVLDSDSIHNVNGIGATRVHA